MSDPFTELAWLVGGTVFFSMVLGYAWTAIQYWVASQVLSERYGHDVLKGRNFWQRLKDIWFFKKF